ncbi:DNA-directed DNA/RNA polymerase mu [Chelonia mydas]|uniref:DNA-directed DNA/RNA polymerase mu n=1 Tax=Chelonia mydas TaxID=8469 RepID=M7B2F2_CHEMY|nr:DNA-directed DNA/RNA polymerase mu [Chelonia mydas]
MALVPLKRRRRAPSPPAGPPGPGRFPAVVLCLVEKRMGARGRAFLTQLARAKGFRVDRTYRAASMLKALPGRLGALEELGPLPGIGEHSRRVIQDVLEDGVCAEVERVKLSERYRTMKLFTKIFGVGVRTASRWYQEGLRTFLDLQERSTKLTRQQQAGLQHYDDLNTPVERSEAPAGRCRSRGKPRGHDVDLLLTHPEEGREVGLLSRVVSWLDSQGLILYQHSQENSYGLREGPEPLGGRDVMDRFERCFSIFRLEAQGGPGAARGWKAVRVDLVVAPHFERELRRFASRERKMVLNSHALYDTRQNLFLPAASEEEIFQHLGLEYVPPAQRNA